MFRITKYIFTGALEPYFGTDGSVQGLAAKQLGIDGYSSGTVFNDLANNRIPGTDDKWTVRNVANRRAGWDMMIDVQKSFSIHFAKTRDPEMLRLFCQSNQETMQAIEGVIGTRVRRGKGCDGYQTYMNRTTGNAVWSTFVHEDARPVNGTSDMNLHAHNFLYNGTFDSVEGYWKAVEPARSTHKPRRFGKCTMTGSRNCFVTLATSFAARATAKNCSISPIRISGRSSDVQR
jgi:conjugative relaxase-like TrwC/TraI family protein